MEQPSLNFINFKMKIQIQKRKTIMDKSNSKYQEIKPADLLKEQRNKATNPNKIKNSINWLSR